MTDGSAAIRDSLRSQAAGDLGREAAIELLIRACGGALIDGDPPWLTDHPGSSGHLLDAEALVQADQRRFTVTEGRILSLVYGLYTGRPISLPEALQLPRAELELVLAAMAHAGASHDHLGPVDGIGGKTWDARVGSLYPWPGLGRSGEPDYDYRPIDGWSGPWRLRNVDRLSRALLLAGIRPGRKDRSVLAWLASAEPRIAYGVATLIERAARAAPPPEVDGHRPDGVHADRMHTDCIQEDGSRTRPGSAR